MNRNDGGLGRHREKIIYLAAAAWNTVFGLFVFAALYYFLSEKVHYLLVLVLSNVISITNAYLSYKFFVFKTYGNHLREYLRFYLVYGASFLINVILMLVFVDSLGINPVFAQGIVLFIILVSSYVSHKYYSFKCIPSLNPRSEETIAGCRELK